MLVQPRRWKSHFPLQTFNILEHGYSSQLAVVPIVSRGVCCERRLRAVGGLATTRLRTEATLQGTQLLSLAQHNNRVGWIEQGNGPPGTKRVNSGMPRGRAEILAQTDYYWVQIRFSGPL